MRATTAWAFLIGLSAISAAAQLEPLTKCFEGCAANDAACHSRCQEQWQKEVFCPNSCGPSAKSCEEWAQFVCRQNQQCVAGMMSLCPAFLPECSVTCWPPEEPKAEAPMPSPAPSPAPSLPPPPNRSSQECENRINAGLESLRGKTSYIQIYSGGSACRENDRRRWSVEGYLTWLKKDGTSVVDRSVEADYDHRFTAMWFASGHLEEESDRNSGVQSRIYFAPGVGLEKALSSGTFTAETGVTATRENLFGEPPTTFPEVWASTITRWRIRPGVTLRETVRFFSDARETRRHRWESRTNFSVSLFGAFSLTNTIAFSWNNAAPFGYPKSSLGTVTELKYSFASGTDR